MGAFEIFVITMAVLVLLVKSYTGRDLAKARERLAEAETDSKRIKGQLKIIQFERAPISHQLSELEKTLSSQNREILAIQTQLGNSQTKTPN
jgi:septal ring factor EnvC (AmiA/AmiB activator)